eukprot:SAG31_NODE_6797_length_1884_cov_1.099720_3_plen_70_part_00
MSQRLGGCRKRRGVAEAEQPAQVAKQIMNARHRFWRAVEQARRNAPGQLAVRKVEQGCLSYLSYLRLDI